MGAVPFLRMAVVSFLVIPTTASGASYHVRPGGSDSNSGLDYDHSWQTIAKANTSARPGDKVYVYANSSGYAHFPNPDSAGSNPTGGGRITFVGAALGADPLSDSTARAAIKLPGDSLFKPYTVLKGLFVDGADGVGSCTQE